MEVISALGHNLESVEGKPATCTETGYTAHQVCTRCNSKVGYEVIPTIGHSEGEWKIDKQPTCTEIGCKHKECITCGVVLERGLIEKTPHNWDEGKETINPTCTAAGLRIHTCKDCNETKMEVISALGHNLESVEGKPATCTETGYTAHQVCTRCNSKVGYEVIPTIGHSESEWKIDKQPTCTETGCKHKECITCGVVLSYERLEKTNHSYTETVTVPTCTTQGYTTHTCSKCGDTYTDTYVNAIGHIESIWFIDVEATCTTMGSKHNECTVCGNILEIETIPVKNNHSYGDILTHAATCEQAGYTYQVCAVCGHIEKIADIEAKGHSESDWIIDIEATCSVKGSRHKECTNCGVVVSIEGIDAIGHNWAEDWSHNEYTHWNECNNGCGTRGNEEAHICNEYGECTICGDLTTAKENAKNRIEQKCEEAKKEVAGNKDLKNEEKNKLNDQIDREVKKGKAAVDGAGNLQDIDESVKDTEQAINGILDSIDVSNIDIGVLVLADAALLLIIIAAVIVTKLRQKNKK